MNETRIYFILPINTVLKVLDNATEQEKNRKRL